MTALAAPFPRLLAAARARAGADAIAADGVLALGPAAGGGVTALPAADALPARLLVAGWLGTHRDARVPLLRELWDLEEAARASGRETIALRFAPLVGGGAPLVSRLADRPRPDARTARALVQPLLEADAVAGLARLLGGHVPWTGWYEVCGRDAVTVAELAAMAAGGAWGTAAGDAAWEPAPEVLAAQGLAEWAPWADACGVTPQPIAATLPAGAVRS